MTDLDRILERVEIDTLMKDLNLSQQKEIYGIINSFKSFSRNIELDIQTIPLLIFLYQSGYIQTKGEK